jgi:hypothetical protein
MDSMIQIKLRRIRVAKLVENCRDLGRIVGNVNEIRTAVENDPMNDCVGFTPDAEPQMLAYIQSEGFKDLREFCEVVELRTSHRWTHFHLFI